MIVVVTNPWTIENGFLTPTLKIKRSKIEADVAGKVDGWFGTHTSINGAVIWA
jgi:long-chain acyl-CoA synthetase